MRPRYAASESQAAITEEVHSVGAVTTREPAVKVDFRSSEDEGGDDEVEYYYTVPRNTIETVVDGRRVLMVANERKKKRPAKSSHGRVDSDTYKEPDENWPANRRMQELFPMAKYEFEPPRANTPQAVQDALYTALAT